MQCEHEFERQPNTPLFTDAGIIPSGDCWVVPTDAFLKLWGSPAGNDLRKQGVRMRHDGKGGGASQDCIVYFTASTLAVNR